MANVVVDGVYYKINKSKKTATVTGIKKRFLGKVVILSEVEGCVVTVIGDSAFSFRHVTSVEIPDTVTDINLYAFACCKMLTSVTIPSSVEYIGFKAFDGCVSLSEINVSEDNDSYSSADGILFTKEKTEILLYPIGKTAEEYVVPLSVVHIGSNSFKGCANLKNIIIPNSVKNIREFAFSDSGLTSITIPASVERLHYEVFSNCRNMTNATILGPITELGELLFNNCKSLVSVVLPDSVVSFDYGAFCGCTSLATFTLPEATVVIEADVFYDCDSLEYVRLSRNTPEDVWRQLPHDIPLCFY